MTTEAFSKKVLKWIKTGEDRLASKTNLAKKELEDLLVLLTETLDFLKRTPNEEPVTAAPSNELILGWIRFRKEEIIPSDKHDRYGIQLGKLSDPVRAQLLLLFGLEDLLRKPENY